MLQMDLTLYDPSESRTSKVVPCDSEFCTATSTDSNCTKGESCPYEIKYGDGSSTTGSFVKDILTFDQVDGDLHDVPDNSTDVIFG